MTNLPKILIIGEMNSGKSTLFNRLAREKKAVTSEIPGTTRDWLDKIVNFEDKPAELIDTAGFLETEDSQLETQIKQIWQEKLKEATIFLIVVDSKVGPTPRIKMIINQIRNFNKPIILVINKVDNPGLAQEKLNLFSELGVKNTLCVSALLGKNLNELHRILAEFLPRTESKNDKRLKIAIIGRPNVGKSTLLNALIGQERAIVNKESGTTRDELEAELDSQSVLVDTPGLKRHNKIKTIVDFFSSRRSIHMSQNADLIIFVLDASEGLVQQEYKIARLLAHYNKPLILVLNKIDLVDSEEIQKTQDYIKYKLKFLGEFPITNLSANLKQNLEPLRQLIQEASQKLH